MKKALVIEQSDMKHILSEYFGVPESNIFKSQYTSTVSMGNDEEETEEKDD